MDGDCIALARNTSLLTSRPAQSGMRLAKQPVRQGTLSQPVEYGNAAGCSFALNPRSSRRSAASRSLRRSSGGVAPTPATPATPARRYRGILTGERLKSVEIRVASAVLEHAQSLFDPCGAAADPYMTVVDYFTSTRELAGMRRLVDDDVADRLASQQVRTKRPLAGSRPVALERNGPDRVAGSTGRWSGRDPARAGPGWQQPGAIKTHSRARPWSQQPSVGQSAYGRSQNSSMLAVKRVRPDFSDPAVGDMDDVGPRHAHVVESAAAVCGEARPRGRRCWDHPSGSSDPCLKGRPRRVGVGLRLG